MAADGQRLAGVRVRWDRGGFVDAAPPPQIALPRAPEIRALAHDGWTRGDATVSTSCWAAPLSFGWPGHEVDSMVLDKLVEIASKRVEGPLRGEVDADGTRVFTSPRGAGKVFLGFEGGVAIGCVLACEERGATSGDLCVALSRGASLDGGMDLPPSPGLALRAASAAVHHPRGALCGLLGALVLLGVGLVRFRKRPT